MGLNKDLNLIVKSQKPSTLEEAITLAQAEEKELQSRKAVDKFQTPYFKRPNLNPTHFEKTKPNTFVSRPNTTRLGSRPVSPWKPSFAFSRKKYVDTVNMLGIRLKSVERGNLTRGQDFKVITLQQLHNNQKQLGAQTSNMTFQKTSGPKNL